MKKIVVWFMMLCGSLIWNATTHAWSYPVKEVTWNFCWASWEVCTIDLPRISNADYLQYISSPLYREVYSVLWGGTYYNWWDYWFWSHQGVDITSTLGTPIRSMGDGEIVEAQERWDWGNTIVIKHKVGDTELWSVYAHLDQILVKKGDVVKEGDLIGKMWATGNTTWIHVHFQIDTSDGKHPYFPAWCEGTITEIVNEGRCWNQIKDHTLDPILFLETNGAIFLAEHSDTVNKVDNSFIDANQLEYSLESSIIKKGRSTVLSIQPKDKSLHDVFLQDTVSIEATTGITLTPSRVSYLGSWRNVTLVGNEAWLQKVNVKVWESNKKKYTMFVLSDDMIKTLREKFKGNEKLIKILDELE